MRRTRKLIAHGTPIPEMIAGAIMGAIASLVLTYVSALAPLLRPEAPTLYLILGAAALMGATISFFLAREHVVEVQQSVEREPIARRRAA